MRAGIALGSNLGNRMAELRAGREFLHGLDCGGGEMLVSAVYETEPVDCASGTPAFLNAVVEIGTFLDPKQLLSLLRSHEKTRGRRAGGPENAPRNLDLDLLYADGLRLQGADLVLPHPRMAGRRFVMQPLADIRPDLVLPGQRESVAQLLASLPASPSVRIFATDW